MTEKEIAEIRRRFNIDKTNIRNIRGCYVNENKEIISDFNQFFGTMPRDEAEKILAIIKKTLSGTIGRNLIDIEFSNQQVIEGEEHKLLMTLRNSELDDDEAADELYKHIIQSMNTDEKFLILLTYEKYDVPSFTKDDEKLEDAADVFSYILCSVCPVKMTKPALSYYVNENQFRNIASDWIIAPPELGFMFPAFDDRQANIYNALYYTRSITDSHTDFVDAIFKSEIPMPASEQKEVFNSILEETVSEDCSFKVMQTVHEQISSMIAEHKANKDEQPLSISRETVKDVLEYCGVSQEHVKSFEEKYNSSFGEDTQLSPKNIVDSKQFEVKMPDITIKVNPEQSHLVQTRIIDGVKYIMIRADENVEVNGVNINIT
ncbi:DUF4317 domain-containing protein [Porcipelethomonas sp.]|uniref:DUF4317 domain-containing protein n=1 Tax=Porcipelethomonas sp. TaxID=2981675 RepID=UPI003EF604B4